MAQWQLAWLVGLVSLAVSNVAAVSQPDSSGRTFGGGLSFTQPLGSNAGSAKVRPWAYGDSGGGASGYLGSDFIIGGSSSASTDTTSSSASSLAPGGPGTLPGSATSRKK